MAPGEVDGDLYRFWPLNEIVPVHDVLSEECGDRYYPGCFLFAD